MNIWKYTIEHKFQKNTSVNNFQKYVNNGLASCNNMN